MTIKSKQYRSLVLDGYNIVGDKSMDCIEVICRIVTRIDKHCGARRLKRTMRIRYKIFRNLIYHGLQWSNVEMYNRGQLRIKQLEKLRLTYILIHGEFIYHLVKCLPLVLCQVVSEYT